jgi:hypothetical protein
VAFSFTSLPPLGKKVSQYCFYVREKGKKSIKETNLAGEKQKILKKRGQHTERI